MSDDKPSAGAIEAANQFYSGSGDRDTAARVIERVAVAPRLAAAEAENKRLREALSLIGNIVGDEKEIVVVLKAPYPDLIRAALAETERAAAEEIDDD